MFFLIAFLARSWQPNITGYASFILYGLVMTPLSLLLFYALGFLANPKSAGFVARVLKEKLGKK